MSWLPPIIILVIAMLVFFIYRIFQIQLIANKHHRKLLEYLESNVVLTPAQRKTLVESIHDEMRVSQHEYTRILLQFLLAVLSIFIILILIQNNYSPMNVIVGYLIVVGVIVTYFRIVASRRKRKIFDQLPTAIDMLTHYIINEVPMHKTIKALSQQLPKPIAEYFTKTSEKLIGGESFSKALLTTAQEYHIFELEYFAMILILQYEVGTNTVEILTRFVESLRRQRALYQKVQSLKTDLEFTEGAAILGTLYAYWLFNYQSPEIAASFNATPIGKVLTYASVILLLIGVFLIRKIMRVV